MELIVSLLPHAIAVALSPIPIAALILILLSKKARVNSIAYLLGWVSAILINVGTFIIIFNKPLNTDISKPIYVLILQLILGIFLIFLAIKEWRMRPKGSEKPKIPRWMNSLENMSPFMAFLIAFGLVTINAKNTVIDISAGVEIGQNSFSLFQACLILVIYTLIASSTIIIPVIIFLISGNRLNGKLEEIKTWFIFHNSLILFVLFLILGLNILTKIIRIF